MKLVVNLLLGLDMQAIAEAVSLGEHLQIDRNVLLDVLSKTAVVAPAMAGKFRKIKDSDYSPEFPLRLMSKDMDLVMDAAKAAGADLACGFCRSICTCLQCSRKWRPGPRRDNPVCHWSRNEGPGLAGIVGSASCINPRARFEPL